MTRNAMAKSYGDEGYESVDLNKNSSIFENRIARELHKMDTSSRWLTTYEAAKYLRVSIAGLKALVYRGKVRVHKLGRRNRYLVGDLDRLIVGATNIGR